MKLIKKYTAIQISTNTINEVVKVDLEYGDINGPYYDQQYPEEEFDTEEEALAWAYKECEYARWLILPIVRFDN